MWPVKFRALLDNADGKLQDLIEAVKADVRAKVE